MGDGLLIWFVLPEASPPGAGHDSDTTTAVDEVRRGGVPLSSSPGDFSLDVALVQRLPRSMRFPSQEVTDQVVMAPAAFETHAGFCIGPVCGLPCLLVVLDVDLFGFVF